MQDSNINSIGWPRQRILKSRKNKEWMKNCINYAATFTYPHSELFSDARSHIKSNRDLLKPNGTLKPSEYMSLVNPAGIKAKYVPKEISHYNIMNAPLHVLEGEEYSRPFEYKLMVTNMNGISEVEEAKMNDAMNKLMSMLQDPNMTEEQYQEEVGKLEQYYKYSYQDIREIWGNCILNQYWKEDNFPLMFNKGFWDAFSSAWEVYDINHVGSEPTITWVDPIGLSVLMSKQSSNVEDAMVVSYTTYMHVSEVIDKYSGDVGNLKGLTQRDIDTLEKYAGGNVDGEDSQNPYDVTSNYYKPIVDDVLKLRDGAEHWSQGDMIHHGVDYDDFDTAINGYVKVTEVRWKSLKRIRRVKRYNLETGETEYHIFGDNYVPDKDMGEEFEELWINDPYQGVKIGDNIYVRCGERQCKFRKIDNPSECHLGYVGSLYSFDNVTPYSLVDMMRKHAILYDVIMDKLLRFIARDNGKAVRVDLAKTPHGKGWDMNAVMYFFYTHGIMFENTFNEGDKGAATGKLVGALNNNSNPTVDADMSAVIAQYINILTYIKTTLNEMIGIMPQRMGQVSNRETVGGVERATLQSSHITEWVFMIHEDIKRRACEAFIDQSKWCYANKSKKIRSVLPDYVIKTYDIDGEYYRLADYGIVLDNTNTIKELNQRLDMLAQAALQTQVLNFSAVMELYSSCSLSEKMVLIRKNEEEVTRRQQEQQQQAMQVQQQQIEQQGQIEQAKMQLEDSLNQRDNETKILVANIQKQYSEADANKDGIAIAQSSSELMEKMRQFDEQMKVERDRLALEQKKLEFDRQKAKDDNKTKVEIAKMKPKTTTNAKK